VPRNDYECPVHGVREIWFEGGKPPRRCRDCRRKIRLVVSPQQFVSEGRFLTEREKNSIEMQLGVRPESPDHLRRIEREKQVTAISKQELYRTERSTWSEKKPDWTKLKLS
jgi:hypothetical protein